MDKRSRLQNRKLGSRKAPTDEIVDEQANLDNWKKESNCDVALEVEITRSIEVLLKANNKPKRELFTRNGLCNKTDVSMSGKDRSKLLEECKLILMGNESDDESLHCEQPVQKKRENKRKAFLRRDPASRNEKCVNSAPINTSNQLPGPSSNVLSRSVDSVEYTHRHNKRCKEMGDYWASDRSSETHSEKMRRLKRKLTSKRDTDIGDTLRQVYATARTSNLRQLLKCQNPNRDQEDPKQPCFCQHCGMVDVLLDSQKRLYTDDNYDVEDSDDMDRNKPLIRSRLDFSKSFEKRHLNELRDRVKRIETALREHQEKCVTKDYLKLVVDKLISYIAPKSEHRHSSRSKTPTKKDNFTQCKSKSARYKDTATLKIESGRHRHNNPIVGNMFAVQKSPARTIEQETDELCLKWGEESIKPGLDLKHKILQLINDALGASKVKKDVSEKKFETNTVSQSERTLYLYGSENQAADTTINLRNSTISVKSGGNFRKMLDYMSEKIYSDYIRGNKDEEQMRLQRKHAISDDVFKRNMQNAKRRTELLKEDVGESINEETEETQKLTGKSLVGSETEGNDGKVQVAYMSSRAVSWKDSCVCFKVEEHFKKYIENNCRGRISSEDRVNFMKKVAVSKNCNDVKLWQSIWTAAKSPGLSRNDKLAVQIPEILRPKGKGFVIKELEFSVAEIHDIANQSHTGFRK